MKYDQAGNIVLREVRDYLGALTDVERVDRSGRPLPGAGDAELAVMQVCVCVFVRVCWAVVQPHAAVSARSHMWCCSTLACSSLGL